MVHLQKETHQSSLLVSFSQTTLNLEMTEFQIDDKKTLPNVANKRTTFGILDFLLKPRGVTGGWHRMGQEGWTREPPFSDASAFQVQSLTVERAMTLGYQEQDSKPTFLT